MEKYIKAKPKASDNFEVYMSYIKKGTAKNAVSRPSNNPG